MSNYHNHRLRLFFFLPRAQDLTSALHSSPLLSFSPPFPLAVGPLNTARGLGERCKLPSGVWCKAPADKRFGAYWSQKVQLWWQQFLLIFLRFWFCPQLSRTLQMQVSNKTSLSPHSNIPSRTSNYTTSWVLSSVSVFSQVTIKIKFKFLVQTERICYSSQPTEKR